MSANPTEEQFLKDLHDIFGDRVFKFNPELYEHLKSLWLKGGDFEREETRKLLLTQKTHSQPYSHLEDLYLPVYMCEFTGRVFGASKRDPSRGVQKIEYNQILRPQGSEGILWHTSFHIAHPFEVYVNGDHLSTIAYSVSLEHDFLLNAFVDAIRLHTPAPQKEVSIRWFQCQEIVV